VNSSGTEFATRVIRWHHLWGRHHLPWQQTQDPYRIWVSEIMLQQTQVATVIPYFNRFLKALPTLNDLAQAELDEVLRLWTGLGYYARARHLHRAAREVIKTHHGLFPERIEEVAALPGIGRSTAGAILVFAFGHHLPILDGNVKRVLARWYALPGWPGHREVESKLWQHAWRNTPQEGVERYTQGIMDIGATICLRRAPLCEVCPVGWRCRARRASSQALFPAPKPSHHRPLRTTTALMIHNSRGELLLERRPPSGVWGGLWSLPESGTSSGSRWQGVLEGPGVEVGCPWPEIRHTFSHFTLVITPLPVHLKSLPKFVEEGPKWVWYRQGGELPGGVATPVLKLLKRWSTMDNESP